MWLCRVAVFAVITGVSACQYRVPRDPHALVVALANAPVILNPLLAADSYSSEVNQHLFESLIDRHPDTLEPLPKLAAAWTISEDGKKYTFSLRRDVVWHDGVPFTADDVVFTFERIRDPAVDAARLRHFYRDVENIEKLDAYTVRFTYRYPYAYALTMLGKMRILPKHRFSSEEPFNTHPANSAPIGTGPFRFTSWNAQRLTLSRNETWWGQPSYLSAIVFRIVPDATVQFQLLKKGDLDVVTIQPIQWARQTTTDDFTHRFQKLRFYLPNFVYVGWNHARPFFRDAAVRRALTMMIDRQGIVDKQLFGNGEVVSGPFYPFGPSYDQTIAPLSFDPAEAEKMLTEAGWSDHDGDGIRDKDGVAFRFTYVYSTGSKRAQSIGLFLREELARIGVDMELRQLEWATLLGMVTRREYDAVSLSWNLPFDGDPYSLWHSSQAAQGSNITGFADPEVDHLLELARTTFDEQERFALYRKLHRLLHEAQPCSFLFSEPSLVIVSRRFENIHQYRMGIEPLEWHVADASELFEW